MVITYLGNSLIKITQGDLVISCNPYKGEGQQKAPRFGADIVLVSKLEKNYDNVESSSFGNKIPFVATGPGEYEVGGIYIKGVATKNGENQKTEGLNTSYTILLDGIKLCHLGGISSKSSMATKEAIGEVDVLFVPIGGDDVIDTKDAAATATFLEAKVVVPINYSSGKGKNILGTFLKESGIENLKGEDKLNIKKKDVEGKEGEVVVLNDVS